MTYPPQNPMQYTQVDSRQPNTMPNPQWTPQPQNSPAQQPTPQKTCIWSILSLVFAFVMPLLGFIFSVVALVQIRKDPSLKGKGLAIAGIVISLIIFIAFIAILLLGMVATVGVISPSVMLPPRCEFGGGLSCDKLTVHATDTTMTQSVILVSAVGSTIVLLTNESSCERTDDAVAGSISIDDASLEDGGTTTVTCTLSRGTHKKGDRIRVNYTLLYYPESGGEAYKKTLRGDTITVLV